MKDLEKINSILESWGEKPAIPVKVPKRMPPVNSMCPFCSSHDTYQVYTFTCCSVCGSRGLTEPYEGKRSFNDVARIVWDKEMDEAKRDGSKNQT